MNILIIGLGSIAKKHIAALRIINIDFKIYALRSNSNNDEEAGIENIFNLDDVNIFFDFAIISNPTHLHFEYIEKLAKKGINLLIEKPAIHSLDNYDMLIKLINQEKIKTYVACNLRFHPCIIYLRNKIIKENLKINEVNVYCGSYLPDWRPGKDFRSLYSSIASMGGGVHLDLIHELDYITWLFGLPNESKSFLKSVSSLNIDSVDYANYVLGYDKFTVNIILNYYRRKPKREIEIVLENEILTVDLINNSIKNDQDDFLFQDNTFNLKETYIKQIKYFINCLNNNETPMNSLPEAIEILKICLQND
jgi:predicted dehydrogenase